MGSGESKPTPVPQPRNATYGQSESRGSLGNDWTTLNRVCSERSTIVPWCSRCKTQHSRAVPCPTANVQYVRSSAPNDVQPNTNIRSHNAGNDFVIIPPGSSNTTMSEVVELCPRCITQHSPFIECPVAPPSTPIQEYVTCPNKVFGCMETYTTSHYESCLFKKTVCPIGKYLANCSWEGAKCKLNGHVNNAHPNNIVYKLDIENRKNTFSEDVEDWEVQVIYHEDETFVFYMKVCYPWFYTAVQLIGSEVNAKLWTYKINIFTKNKKGKNIILSEACTSANEDVMQVFASGVCGVIPLHVIRNYVSNHSQLTFKLRVFKLTKKQNNNIKQNDNNRNRRM